jgi:hypothetical protein
MPLPYPTKGTKPTVVKTCFIPRHSLVSHSSYSRKWAMAVPSTGTLPAAEAFALAQCFKFH